MFRTRDYVLMLSATMFLLVGIGATLMTQAQWDGQSGLSATAFIATSQPENYQATVTKNSTLSREERISELKKKISVLGISAAPAEDVIFESSTTTENSQTDVLVREEKRCISHNKNLVSWNPSGVVVEEVEGARIAYRKDPATTLGTTTPTTVKEILLQLPLRSSATGIESCIPTDIIGITTDGHLIRNSEINTFSVFKQNTLIGYALDGFPIYGVSTLKKDTCGGVIISGEYRYQLDTNSKTIISCFSDVPVAL